MNFSFDGLKGRLNDMLKDYVESRVWPVPEAAVNLALSLYQKKQMPELERLEIKVLDGCFEIHVKGRKGVSFESVSKFTFESCEISSEKQVLTLRQLGKTQAVAETLQEQILLAVVQAVFLVVLRTDPAAYVLKKEPGVHVAEGLYTINLAETAIADYVQGQSRLLELVNGYAINQIICKPGLFEVKARAQAAVKEEVANTGT